MLFVEIRNIIVACFFVLVNEQDFGEWSERTKLSPSDYRSQTMKALSGESFNGRKFEYDVQEEGGNGSVVLTWKRILDDEDIKVLKIQQLCLRLYHNLLII